ncbi:MAG: outer membrane beta-barrel protein [Paludibacter sp.]
MKQTLKLGLLFVLLTAVISTYAQTYRLEVGYNNPIRFGANVSSTKFNGIRIGGTAEFALKNNFSLLTGVLYNIVYSNKLQGYPNSDSVTYKTWGHHLEIPLQVKYTYPITKNLKVFGFAGPNFNVGLLQNQETISTMSTALNQFHGITPGKSELYKDGIINRLNLQVGVGGGVQWKKYLLKSGYDFGLNKLNRTETGNVYQSGWYISLAYEF